MKKGHNRKQLATITGGRSSTKEDGTHFMSFGNNTNNPQREARELFQRVLDTNLKSGPVKTVTDRIGEPEKMSELEIKRIKIINAIRRSSNLKHNSFLKSLLFQRAPLSEAQCDKALQTIKMINFQSAQSAYYNKKASC